MRHKPTITLAVAVLVVGLACSGAPKQEDTSSKAGPQQIDTATPTTPAPTAPAGPVTAFADGTYEIGAVAGQVPAGKYKTTVPPDSFGCYWERLKGLSGQFGDIIANGTSDKGAPVIVTIAPTDKGFTTRGCGTWTKV